MTFLHPQFFHLLWLLPMLVVLRLWSAKDRAAASFVAARLRAVLVTGVSAGRSWAIFGLHLLALAAFICAMTRPHYGVDKREITESGKNVIVAIDTSRSMLADDVTPNRLLRAKLAAQDIVLTLQGERVGLVAFAGRGYLQAPLTTDHDAVIETLQALDTNTIPRGGTMISDAIREALEAFEKSKARAHGLILFSDGGDDDPELASVLAKAKEKHVLILTVGVGTDAGSLIPDPDPTKSGDFVRDPATGNPVHTRLEEETLQRIARETGGRYLRLGSQSLSASVVTSILSSLDAMENGSREEVKPIDRFYYPLSAGIFALMLAMLLRPTASLPRVSPALAALMMLFIGPAVSKASVFSSSNSKAEAANDAYQSRDFTQARDLYARLLSDNTTDETKERLSYGLGAACQQLKEYDRAIEGFSKSLESRDPTLQSLSHQGLGTALYDQGAKSLQQQPEYAEKAWSDSLRHFEAAAKLNPDRKVTENLDFVKKQLAELKKQIQQEKGKQKKKGDKNKDKGNGDKDKGPKGDESEEGDDQGEKGDPKDGQKQDKDGDQKDGDQKDGKQQDGSSGDQKDQKQSQSGKDGDEKDGQKGEAMEQKDDTKGPEGKIQAAEKGEGSSQQNKDQQTAQMMAEEEKKQDQTGYSRNEARNLLRTYNDMMAAQRPNRREHNVTKDW